MKHQKGREVLLNKRKLEWKALKISLKLGKSFNKMI